MVGDSEVGGGVVGDSEVGGGVVGDREVVWWGIVRWCGGG